MVFELIRYPILLTASQEDAESGSGDIVGAPEEVDVVVLDVLPSEIVYKRGNKATYHVGAGDGNTTVDKGGNAPIKVMLTGTFGNRFINRGIKVQDGFGRLKEFRKFFEKSNTLDDMQNHSLVDNKRYIYGLNYYDFTFHEWFSINLDTFDVSGNAERNSKLPFYQISFTSLGKFIRVDSQDPILRNLKVAIAVQEQFDEWNAEIDKFIKENPYAAAINEVLVDIEQLQVALNSLSIVNSQYQSALGNAPGNLLGTIGTFIPGSNNFLDFANLI